MAKHKNLILIDHFCTYHNVAFSFVENLQEYGLLEIINENNQHFIEENELAALEKMTRLHYELDVNLEGIEVINHLLFKIEKLQHELNQLNNKLNNQ